MMKNKKKKKINMTKALTSLKKNLLNTKSITKNIFTNKDLNEKLIVNSGKVVYKMDLINNINSDDEEKSIELLETIYKDDVNKFRSIEIQKDKLKELYLKEENAEALYNWNTLLNRNIPFEKRNEFSMANKKKKHNSFNKIDYNSIDYTKGKNVISKVSNEALLNFYNNIDKMRISSEELSPRLKLKKIKNSIYNILASQRMSYSNKEKLLNLLILNEKENSYFRDIDLKIAYKRKTADVLIKSILSNRKIIEESKNESKYNDNVKENKDEMKKPGLILSTYDENSPDIIKFDEQIQCLSERNRNKNKKNIFDIIEEKYTNLKNPRNIFSANNSERRNNLFKNINSKKEISKNFSGITSATLETMNTSEKNIKRRTMKIKLFKNNKMSKNFSERLYSPKSSIFRPMSSSNLSHLKNNKLYFLNNKSNKRSFSFQDYEEIGFMNGFRRKKTSKVGNSIYDKINNMLKYRFLKKFKLNSKKYYKNLISNTINQNYKKQKEEAKNNKLVQTFLSENLRTSLTKTTDSDILNSITKNRENEKSCSKRNAKFKIYRTKNNFYSCSNNYIVNIKRMNKQKLLNELSDMDYLDVMFKDNIIEDKYAQKDYSNNRIKSIYNHN